MNPGMVLIWYDDDNYARPVIVVSREPLNRGSYVVTVPTTTRRLEIRKAQPNCVFFRKGEFGFSEDCVAQAELIAFLPKSNLKSEAVGQVSDERFRDLIRAIGNVISAQCEPV